MYIYYIQYISVCICVCVSACVYLHVCICVYLRVCICVCVSACVYLRVCICVCVSACVYLRVCICVCVCVFLKPHDLSCQQARTRTHGFHAAHTREIWTSVPCWWVLPDWLPLRVVGHHCNQKFPQVVVRNGNAPGNFKKNMCVCYVLRY